jgi:hypothetical protein
MCNTNTICIGVAAVKSDWRVQCGAGMLRGWGLDAALQPQERWSQSRPSAAPALLAAVPRAADEPLNTAAKVFPCRHRMWLAAPELSPREQA